MGSCHIIDKRCDCGLCDVGVAKLVYLLGTDKLGRENKMIEYDPCSLFLDLLAVGI